MTRDSDFILPGYSPKLVHGSFFTAVQWVLRGKSGKLYGVLSYANNTSFTVIDHVTGLIVSERIGIWKDWKYDGLLVVTKQLTIYVRANGWEMNATRHPIYNFLPGSPMHRFDIAIRPLDSIAFGNAYGHASKTCFPHGILGQSFDGDLIGISGLKDDYTKGTEITTKAQAEGAVEGDISHYELKRDFLPDFKFSRFNNNFFDLCAARSVHSIKGTRNKYIATVSRIASTDDML